VPHCWLSLLSGVCAAALPTVPEATGLLVDQGGLEDSHRLLLEGSLREIQDSGRAQDAVLLNKERPDESLAEYTLRLAEAGKLGRARREDGLLIVLVPSVYAALSRSARASKE